jgi:hypothetical protein
MTPDNSFKSEEGALLRSRLHIRAARRRLRQGKISAGILTLYDAILFAMSWYFFSPERRNNLKIKEGDDLKNDRTLFAILVRSGVVDGKFDYPAFDQFVEDAAGEELPGYDYTAVLKEIQSFMTQLGVMPFDEQALPPADPNTF